MDVQVARSRSRRRCRRNYGIYNGFELLEHEPIPGREEYLNSEKYEIKVRDWNKPGNIKAYLGTLNRSARENPALLQTTNLRFLQVDDDNVIGFVKESVDGDNAVAVAIALTGTARATFWLHFGDDHHRPADANRAGPRRSTNLVDRRAAPARMGRRAPAHRSVRRPGPAVPLRPRRALS